MGIEYNQTLLLVLALLIGFTFLFLGVTIYQSWLFVQDRKMERLRIRRLLDLGFFKDSD